MDEKELKPHEARVVEERYVLDGKITRLAGFLGQSDTRHIKREDIEILTEQLHHMREYLRVLDLRISRFYDAP
jgi:hypothetical protein